MQAAADSPFLDNLLSSASGVLCVLSLPERVMSHDLDMSSGALNDPEKYAIRAAVQVRPVHLLPGLLRTVLTSASEAAQRPTCLVTVLSGFLQEHTLQHERSPETFKIYNSIRQKIGSSAGGEEPHAAQTVNTHCSRCTT
mgnify:CR=1 FL=1